MKKSIFWTFWLSFIPGAGQMYMGYMKRGLSLVVMAAICVSLAGLLNTSLFIVPLAIICMWSFFDTYNVRNNIGTENEIKDEYLLNEKSKGVLAKNMGTLKVNKVIGYTLLFLGIYIVFNNVIATIAADIGIEWLERSISVIRHYMPSVVIAAISIAIGIKIVFGREGGSIGK